MATSLFFQYHQYLSCLAAYLIYYENNKMIKKKTHERRLFMRQLSEELVVSLVEGRSQNLQIMRNLSSKLAIESILHRQVLPPRELAPGPQPARDQTGRVKVTRSCHICYKATIKKRRKTRKSCAACKKPVCDEHAVTLTKCKECAE